MSGPLSFDDGPAPTPGAAGPGAGPPGPPERAEQPRRPGRAPGSRLPRALLLAAGVALLALVGLNTLRTHGESSSGPRAGSAMAPFAAPLALSSLEGDVNVARRAGQGGAGDVPACRVRGPSVLNSCELVRGSPAAVIFFSAGQERCTAEVGRLEQAAGAHPDVRVAAVALGGGRADLRALVRRRGWALPVAHDRDSVLGNLYGVAVCPQITYLLPGGTVHGTTVGAVSARALGIELAGLERAAGGAAATARGS